MFRRIWRLWGICDYGSGNVSLVLEDINYGSVAEFVRTCPRPQDQVAVVIFFFWKKEEKQIRKVIKVQAIQKGKATFHDIGFMILAFLSIWLKSEVKKPSISTDIYL